MAESLRAFYQMGQQAGARYRVTTPRSTLAGMLGAQLGSQAGSSLDFKDYREYQPGDDPRRIDWGNFARSDRLNIKLFREEISPHVDILLDVTRSMDLPETSKAGAAAALTAALASAAYAAHFTTSVYLIGDQVEQLVTRGVQPQYWPDIAFDRGDDLLETLSRSAPKLGRQSIRFLIGDLLVPSDPHRVAQRLAMGGSRLVVIQLLAELDCRPEAWGNVRLADSESGSTIDVFIDGAAVRRYRQALGRLQEQWHRATRQVGGLMITLVAEELLRDWDLSELVAKDILHLR